MTDTLEQREQVFTIDQHQTRIASSRRYYSPSTICRTLKEVGYKHIKIANGYAYQNLCSSIDEKELSKNYVIVARKN